MKHVFFTFCILLTTMAAQAAPITLGKAKENAMAFLTSGNMQRVKGNHTLALAYTRNDTKGVKAPLFHVFNIGDGSGFVIASADDVAVPVLGYCDNGVFDSNDIPVNMQAWLDGYGEEIGKARQRGVVAPRTETPSHASRKKINPMIKSTWDQYAPYNDMCVFDGIRCVTGCVATGMAQIMYYWATTGIDGKKFKCGSTALPAYTTKTQNYSVGALDALTSFDWESMTDGMPMTTKSKTAVAQLMRYCGQSVKMDYEEDGSGAALEDAAEALINNFDYNWGMQVVYSYNMSEEEWQEMAYNELNEGKPFFMSGLGTGGHAFICDGYDPANGQFHFNWGWGGDYDGWFAMTSLKPGGYNFSSMRWGIKGIQPFSDSPYVVRSTDGKTLSFYCDTKRNERTGKIYRLNDEYSYPGWNNSTVGDVENVIIDSSFSNARPKSTREWFCDMKQVKSITGIEYLNTSEVTYMWGMFMNCNALESLDVSHFDTSKVTNMCQMFRGCSNVKSLDVSHFNTSNVTDMADMFYDCSSLESLDVSHFDTSKSNRFDFMFRECKNLENLDVSHFNTSKANDMMAMFVGCEKLRSLDVSHFDTSNVRNFSWMFSSCKSLESIDVSHFNTSKATDMSYMFYRSGLTSLDVSGFNMDKVTQSTYFAYFCTRLKFLRVASGMEKLDNDAFCYVGDADCPCKLVAPSGFDFGFTPSASEAFKWKRGWFILADGYDIFAMGDVNHDGQVNISDVTLVVGKVLGEHPSIFYEENADMNHDGQINITDVTNLVSIILGQE